MEDLSEQKTSLAMSKLVLLFQTESSGRIFFEEIDNTNIFLNIERKSELLLPKQISLHAGKDYI